MLNCKKISEFAARAMDEELPFWENVALKMHLFLCRSCNNFTQQLNFLREISHHAQLSSNFHLSDEARQRISKALKDHSNLHSVKGISKNSDF